MNRRPNIIVCVISDLATDQRIQKVSNTLAEKYHVTVFCTKGTLNTQSFPYKVAPINLLLKRGKLFYIEFNIRLFIKLLFAKADLLLANDSDTLLPCYYASKLKKTKLVFDAHEIMSEVPEVVNRKKVQRFWQWIEKTYIPKVDYKYTVCDSLKNHYNSGFSVIRNVPYSSSLQATKPDSRTNKVIIYQGDINMKRGIELMIEAMPLIKDAEFWIVGGGYQLETIKRFAEQSPAKDRIVFKGKHTPANLKHITVQADLGISIEENIGLNYYYALPNKMMDYIQARIPILVSNFPEMRAIINEYRVGEVLLSRQTEDIARQVTRMLNDQDKRRMWKKNLSIAAHDLCWEKEKLKLESIYDSAFKS